MTAPDAKCGVLVTIGETSALYRAWCGPWLGAPRVDRIVAHKDLLVHRATHHGEVL